MKQLGLLFAALVAFSGQSPAPAASPVRHFVYQFGYNTKVATQGQGTGTTTVDILGPAKDGVGVMISGTDHWWNTPRPRGTNTCEVKPDGSVSCADRPYAISPIQLTIFPLLARDYFKGLTAGGKSTWTNAFKIYAAVIPGASGTAGSPVTWDCKTTLVGQGPIKGGNGLIAIQSTGTYDQEGGHYRQATSKTRIAYDPVAKAPAVVSQTRTHFPQRSVYNNDLIELQLTAVSPRTP